MYVPKDFQLSDMTEYNNDIDIAHNHNLRRQILRLPMNRK